MSSEKTKWVYWGEGMAQPEDLSGWELYDEGRWLTLKGLAYIELDDTLLFRKALTEEQYRIFHAQLADPRKAPDGYDIIDFRSPKYGDMTLRCDQALLWIATGVDANPCYILAKAEPESNIDWVEPTDEDAVKLNRPTVRFRDYEELPWQYDGTLIGVDDSSSPYTIKHKIGCDTLDHHFVYCEMDASLRTKQDDTTEPEENNEIDVERLKVLRKSAEILKKQDNCGSVQCGACHCLANKQCTAYASGLSYRELGEKFLAENPLPEDN